MQKVALIFPDSTALAEFLTKNAIRKAEVQSKHSEMTAELEDDEILDAIGKFEAIVYPKQVKKPS